MRRMDGRAEKMDVFGINFHRWRHQVHTVHPYLHVLHDNEWLQRRQWVTLAY